MNREGNKGIAQQISHQGQRNYGNSPNQTSGIFHNNNKNQQFLLFNFIAYPFQNQRRITFKGLKTVLKSQQIKGNLERLVSLNHQNIIQIERVAKSNVKAHPQSKPETYYSIYYQFVPFSLRKITQATKTESALLPNLNPTDLCTKLVEVSEYLMEIDIYLLLRIEDIGVTEDGEVKVYVSPVALGKEKDQNKASKREVIQNIDKILGWCRTAIASKGRKPSRKSEDGPISNSLGFDTDNKDMHQPKISTSFIEKSNRPNYENNQLQKQIKQTSSTPQTVKRLEDEVRQIKAIMAEKIKGHMHLTQYSSGQNPNNRQPGVKTKQPMVKGRQVKANEIVPDDRRNSGNKQTSMNQQSIQQNINCINIYNNLLLKQSQERIKNLQTQQMYSFKIQSNKQEHAPKNYNRIIHLNTFPQDFHPLDEDQNLSIDTYEMDLGEEFEPKAPDSIQPFRMSLKSPKRDNSERNYNPNKGQASNNSKITNNQVVSSKKVTESAGPLQFKNFIMQHIKPQFLAKKSNIYEDPGEYDSEKSYSLSKKASNYIKELTEAGKSAASYHQKSSSAKRSIENQVQSFSKKKNIQHEQRLKVSQGPKPAEKGLEPSKNFQHQEIKKFIKNQRSEAFITSKAEEVNINDKVKAALEKTRNAIALLNKVKAAKNGPAGKLVGQ